MEFKIKPTFKVEKEYFNNNKDIFSLIKDLNNDFLEETYKGNKVAYYYKNEKTGDIISYNEDICFYAASSIKVLVCLMLFIKANKGEIDLNKKILISMEDLKQDTGIIKYQKENTEYSILELIKLTIIESDNTAYLKLVDIVGKENIKKFGLELGASHTMESKPTDSFGIINCNDMIIYWEAVKRFIDSNERYGMILKKYLLNPSFKIVSDSTLKNHSFVRKYGSWDIAYHEAGYIDDEYYLIILTQLNKFDYRKKFVNRTAKKIIKINSKLTKI